MAEERKQEGAAGGWENLGFSHDDMAVLDDFFWGGGEHSCSQQLVD